MITISELCSLLGERPVFVHHPSVCELCLGWHPGPSCRSRANLRQAGCPRGTVEPEAASWPTTLYPPTPTPTSMTLTHTHTQSPLYLTAKNSSIDLSNSPASPSSTHTFRHTQGGHTPKSWHVGAVKATGVSTTSQRCHIILLIPLSTPAQTHSLNQ